VFEKSSCRSPIAELGSSERASARPAAATTRRMRPRETSAQPVVGGQQQVCGRRAVAGERHLHPTSRTGQLDSKSGEA